MPPGHILLQTVPTGALVRTPSSLQAGAAASVVAPAQRQQLAAAAVVGSSVGGQRRGTLADAGTVLGCFDPEQLAVICHPESMKSRVDVWPRQTQQQQQTCWPSSADGLSFDQRVKASGAWHWRQDRGDIS